jgi:glycosyltransferase involved in cell wall biosynthesis
MAQHHLFGAGAVVVPSLRLHSLMLSEDIKSLPPVSLCYKGFHPEMMGDYGGRRGPLVVGWAGNADQTDKNVPMIIKAWPKELRVADRCLTQGEMGDFYNSIDVITCMSDAEGDPRTLIEGMACGCFPVTVDVGVVPELVKHGENGLIIPKTTEALAAALAWCRDNVDFVRAAGRRNAQEMLRTRTWAAAASSWGDAFDAALRAT